MAYNRTRLTLYAILSAIEEDMRSAICTHLDSGDNARDLLGNLWPKIKERLEEDIKLNLDNPPIEQLLYYADFADLYSIINASAGKLPSSTSKYYKGITRQLERLVAVRNRIAHTRPLNYDDFPETID